MRIRLALTLVILISTAGLPVHAGENKDCRLKQFASVDLARPSGSVLVPVTIQGNSVWMALDSASAFSLVFDDQAHALNLHRRSLQLPLGVSVGAKGEVTQVAESDDFQIGGARYRKIVFPILSRGTFPAEFDHRPIIGGLGMDVFSAMDFELNIAHGKLNLFSQDHCNGRVVYWSQSAAPIPVKRGDFVFPSSWTARQSRR